MSPTDPGFDPNNVPSLQLVYEQAQRISDLVLSHADAIDAKAGILVAAASFVIGGVAGLQAVDGGSIHALHLIDLLRGLAILAAASYIAVVVCVFNAFMVRVYRLAPEPRSLYMDLLTAHYAFTQLAITQKVLRDYYTNVQLVRDKEAWLRAAMAAVISEAVVLAIILFVIAWTL